MTKQEAIEELSNLNKDWLDGSGLCEHGVKELINKIFEETHEVKSFQAIIKTDVDGTLDMGKTYHLPSHQDYYVSAVMWKDN